MYDPAVGDDKKGRARAAHNRQAKRSHPVLAHAEGDDTQPVIHPHTPSAARRRRKKKQTKSTTHALAGTHYQPTYEPAAGDDKKGRTLAAHNRQAKRSRPVLAHAEGDDTARRSHTPPARRRRRKKSGRNVAHNMHTLAIAYRHQPLHRRPTRHTVSKGPFSEGGEGSQGSGGVRVGPKSGW